MTAPAVTRSRPEADAPRSGSEAAGPPAPPPVGGRTEIAGKVLERIATRAVSEVDEASGAARRVLGVPIGRADDDSAPQVEAEVDGELATLRMTVSVAYPAPIRQVARRLREHVQARVAELTGLSVRQVDIEVADLRSATGHSRRVVK